MWAVNLQAVALRLAKPVVEKADADAAATLERVDPSFLEVPIDMCRVSFAATRASDRPPQPPDPATAAVAAILLRRFGGDPSPLQHDFRLSFSDEKPLVGLSAQAARADGEDGGASAAAAAAAMEVTGTSTGT